MASNGAQILRFLCTLARSAGSYSVPKAPFTVGVRALYSTLRSEYQSFARALALFHDV